jgi:hypothetical protein
MNVNVIDVIAGGQSTCGGWTAENQERSGLLVGKS